MLDHRGYKFEINIIQISDIKTDNYVGYIDLLDITAFVTKVLESVIISFGLLLFLQALLWKCSKQSIG